MKNKQLIEILKQYPEDANVVIENLEWGDYDFSFHIHPVTLSSDEVIIVISTENEDN